MKLIYITNNRLPTEKAHGVQISKMCEAFAGEGVDLELIYPKRRGELKDDFFEYYGIAPSVIPAKAGIQEKGIDSRLRGNDKKKSGNDMGESRDDMFKLTKLWCWDLTGIIPKIGFRIQSLTFALNSLLYLLKNKYKGYIYSRDHFSSMILSFNKRFKIIFEVHTLPKEAKFYHKIFFKRIYKFVAITIGLKNNLIKFGVPEDKILVAHDAVDLEEFERITDSQEALRKKLGLPINKKIISYVGKYKTMGESKGVEGLIEAFGGVVKESKDLFLLLVGINKGELEEVGKVFDSFGVSSDNYKIVFHVGREKIPQYLRAVDLLIMNYPNKRHYAYHMSPLKLFEYMATNVPIVTSDLPSIREVLNDKSAIFFEADNVDDLTKKIIFALENKEKTINISSQAKSDVRNYTWKKRAKNILEFISDVGREK